MVAAGSIRTGALTGLHPAPGSGRGSGTLFPATPSGCGYDTPPANPGWVPRWRWPWAGKYRLPSHQGVYGTRGGLR